MTLIKEVNELHPAFRSLAQTFIHAANEKQLPLIVTETRRTMEVMEAYYARGRNLLWAVNEKYKKAGLRPITEEENKKTITNSMPGESWHYFGLAIDFVPVINGEPDWIYNPEDPKDHWDELGGIATQLGLIWGGQFRTFKDRPHVEWHPGYSTVSRMKGVIAAYAWSKQNDRLDVPLKGVYGDQEYEFPG